MTDQELMHRVAEGDARAFEVVYNRHHVEAYSLARAITRTPGGAEEATQDAFLALWRKASTFDAECGTLAAWLFALVRYRSIDWLRRGGSRAAMLDLTEDAAERLEHPERTDDQVLVSDAHERARRMLEELPPEQREVIDLAYFAGYTQTEIAARVGVPLGTVKGRARLGLARMRAALERDSPLARAV